MGNNTTKAIANELGEGAENVAEDGLFGAFGALQGEADKRMLDNLTGGVGGQDIGRNVLGGDEDDNQDLFDRIQDAFDNEVEDEFDIPTGILTPLPRNPSQHDPERHLDLGPEETRPFIPRELPRDTQIEPRDPSGLRGRRRRGFIEPLEPSEPTLPSLPEDDPFQDVPLEDMPLMGDIQGPRGRFGPRRRGFFDPVGIGSAIGGALAGGASGVGGSQVPDATTPSDPSTGGDTGTGDSGTGDSGGDQPTDKGTGGRTNDRGRTRGTGNDRTQPIKPQDPSIPDSNIDKDSGFKDDPNRGFTVKAVKQPKGRQHLRAFRRTEADKLKIDELIMKFEKKGESRMDDNNIKQFQQDKAKIYNMGKVTNFVKGDREVRFKHPLRIGRPVRQPIPNIINVGIKPRILREMSLDFNRTPAYHIAQRNNFIDSRRYLKI